MLGDCEITGVELVPDKMTKHGTKTQASVSTLASPPPTKKLKQARLPFKILDQKPVESKPLLTPTPTKKRKPSDGAIGPQKASKIQRNDENGRSRNPSKHDDAENEVSSSSEAESQCKVNNTTSKCDKPRGLERFVQSTQQLEVTTSSEVIDLTDGQSQSPEKKNPSKGDDEARVESKCEEKDQESVKEERSTHEDELEEEEDCKEETDEKNIEDETLANDLNDSALSNALDTTNASARTISSEGSSDEDSNEDISETGQSNNASTPSQALRKRPPLSSAKKAQKKAEHEARRQEREKINAEKKRQKELEKQKKEEQRKEKERLKEELRLEKEKQKREEKERKEAEKLKKEKERLEKLAEKEREKEEKLKQKEEEKKKKQEALDAKAEEKRKKDEEKEAERKRKEEEKVKQDEGKMRKIQQSQAMFKSFFKKVEKADNSPTVTEDVGSFAAFQVLKNMKMAPIHRVERESLPEKCDHLDTLMQDQTYEDLYLKTLRSGAVKPGRDSMTWPQDDVIVVDPEGSEKPKMKGKLYQFHENYRPAYFGTWRKKSRTISPRNPFKKDEVYLDYEVDSDDEWEEEEPGESLSNSEGEGEEQEQTVEADEDDEDGFFVPHGYLSDGEGCEDDEEDCNPEKLKLRQMVKAKNFEAELNKTTEVLKMLMVGCCWLQKDRGSNPLLDPYKAQILVDDTPISLEQEDSTDTKASKSTKEKRGCKPQGVPDEAVSHLIRLVHGNLYSLKKIMKEFAIFWRTHEKSDKNPDVLTTESSMEVDGDQVPAKSSQEKQNAKVVPDEPSCSISKRQLDLKIRAIANYERRADHRIKCWYVDEEVLTQYGLKDLPVPTDWKWTTKPGKVKNSDEGATPSPGPGKETPTSNPGQGSIKQFAVPGLVQNFPPPPVQSSASPATPGQKPPEKKTPKRITPITLFCSKKGEPAAQQKRCFPQPLPDSQVEISCKSSDQSDAKDDDCMIVDAPFAPPLPSKSQPTLINMFGQKGGRNEKTKDS